ncbi:hypothetical protein PV325_010565 [Microctonus aethiopoides]|nr:hypothetical protein PV325_010565 [Microctonus aethiopoides]
MFCMYIKEYANECEVSDALNNSSVVSESSGCDCSTYSCKCCGDINLHIPHLEGLACANFSYLPEDYGISLIVTFNNYTLINDTISARNPPPMCIGIPELEDIGADLCLRFTNLKYENQQFSGCASISISFYHIIHSKLNLGCFHIPNGAVNKNFASNGIINSITKKEDIYNDDKIDFNAIKKIPTVQII